jgi:hypothetical protein
MADFLAQPGGNSASAQTPSCFEFSLSALEGPQFSHDHKRNIKIVTMPSFNINKQKHECKLFFAETQKL